LAVNENHSPEMKEAFLSLEEIAEFVWSQLTAGLSVRAHPWRVGVLASTSDTGPDARVVVLRGCDRATGTLTFHTDMRSLKWPQILTDCRVSWVFYDAAQAVQLRVFGDAVLASAEDTRAVWDAMPSRSMRSYATLQAPGSVQPDGGSGLGEEWQDGEPSKEAGAWMLPHFGVVRVAVQKLDFLHLRAAGHQRARWIRSSPSIWESTWLTP
jgi:pyridoxine/pyridoxamine 5'-phosphate oxidase